MRKCLVILLALIFIANASACSKTAAKSSELGTSETTAQVITFTDAAFERKVRTALGKMDGDITTKDAKAVIDLDLSNESFDFRNQNPDLNIMDISDIRYFTSLESLNLSFNSFTDLSPLSQLTSLKGLGLTGVRADDFSPLKTLTKINYLTIQWIYDPDNGYYGLESLDVLADMKDMEAIDIKGCGVKDISALSTLPKLWSVLLTENLITDVSPLAGLNLRELALDKNPIEDFSPLAAVYSELEYKDFELN